MLDPTVSKNGARKRKVLFSGLNRIQDRENFKLRRHSPKLKRQYKLSHEIHFDSMKQYLVDWIFSVFCFVLFYNQHSFPFHSYALLCIVGAGI